MMDDYIWTKKKPYSRKYWPMKKISFFYCLLIFIAWSCAKEEDTEEQKIQRPAGKYLSEIRINASPFDVADSSKLVEFVYDNYRYLKTIKFYIPETGQMIRHFDLIYSKDGMLSHIETNYGGNFAMIDERFTYEHKKLVKIEGFKIEDSKTEMVEKAEFNVDSVNNIVEMYPFELKDGVFVKSNFYQKYTFDTDGNLVNYHYNIGQGGMFESMEDYEYNNSVNPFNILDIPYFNLIPLYFSSGESFSMNNVIKQNNYLYEDGVSYNKPDFDTIVYKYKGKYPVESAKYHSSPGFPLELKSQLFYKYVDL